MPQSQHRILKPSIKPRPWRKRLRTWWENNGWRVILGAAIAVCLLSYWGLSVAEGHDFAKATRLDRIYQTLQLFPLNSSIPVGAKPWQFELARFLAPLLTVVAATKMIMLFFHEKMQMFRLRKWQGHVVICGLGEKGKQLAVDMLDEGKKVVIIEADGDNEKMFSCRERGAIVLGGSAIRKSLLTKARVQHAQVVFVVCGNDSLNLEIALLAHGLMTDAVAASPPPSACRICNAAPQSASCSESSALTAVFRRSCFVHLVDTDLRDLLVKSKVLTSLGGLVGIRCFNMYENAARQLFRDHPPDAAARALEQDSVHLLLIGFGQMGQSIVLQAASVGHYANDGRIRVSVVDKLAERKGRLFFHNHPNLHHICDITFHTFDIDDAEFLSGAVLDSLPGGRNSVTQAISCLEQETAGLVCALHLLHLFQMAPRPILVRVNIKSELLSLMQHQNLCNSGLGYQQRTQVQAFGCIADCCSSAMVLDGELDRMARKIHECYRRIKQTHKNVSPTGPSMKDWDDLDADLQTSNRSQAEHLDVKLRTVGCNRRASTMASKQPFTFTPAEVELLAQMEHNRWNAERFLAGWVYGTTKSVEQKISPFLVSWSDLEEGIKDYDREVVIDIPKILHEAGEEVVRG